MPQSIRKTPLDLPRDTLFRKSYSAVIRADGALLPIEERLGKRLLRSIPADSREARELLRRGDVRLRTSEGRILYGLPIEAVFDKLSGEAASQLAEHAGSPEWKSRCQQTLASLERWKRALSSDQ